MKGLWELELSTKFCSLSNAVIHQDFILDIKLEFKTRPVSSLPGIPSPLSYKLETVFENVAEMFRGV
jgi:hypothetical protein